MDAGRDLIPARLTARPRAEAGRLPYYAFRAAEAVVRVIPHRAAYAVGAAVADATLMVQPRRFDGLRDNLRHVMPDADERTLRRTVRRNVRNLAHSWIDVMEMPHRPALVDRRVRPENVENLLTACQRGRGVVVASLHLGSWELGIAGWNLKGYQMALLAEILQPARLFRCVVAARERLGVQVIPLDVASMRGGDPETARRAGAAAIREVYRVLRGGGVVAMAIDRDLIGNGSPMPFFGADAPIPVGVVEVAVRTGAALVPVALVRDGDLVRGVVHPEVRYDAQAPDRPAEVRRATAEVLRVLEAEIRAHPDQWHVLDPIWPVPAPSR